MEHNAARTGIVEEFQRRSTKAHGAAAIDDAPSLGERISTPHCGKNQSKN
jgi:hypothetical protein